MKDITLPRGVWYEEARNRYRVKLYKNNMSYHGGYYKTREDALEAWTALRKTLATIPKLKKGEKPPKQVYGGSVKQLIESSKQESNPNNSL